MFGACACLGVELEPASKMAELRTTTPTFVTGVVLPGNQTPSDKPSCGICLEAHKEPKVLPCCHTFCKSCLDGLVSETHETGPKSTLKCPECRAEHDVPDSGISGFLTDYSLEASLVASRHAETEPLKQTCGECDGGELAVAYCHDCEAFVCESCRVALHRAKRYHSHSIEYLSEGMDPVLPSERVITCPVHSPEKQQAYCRQCQCLVCVHCIIKTHQKHDIDDIAAMQKDIEQRLGEASKQSEEQAAKFEQHLNHLKSVEALVGARVEKLLSAIDRAIDANIALLEKRRNVLHDEVKVKHDTDMKKIWSQKDEVERLILGLKSAIRLSERVKQCSEDPRILSLASQACSRMSELHQHKWTADEMNCIKRDSLEFSHQQISIHLTKFGYLNPVFNTSSLSVNIPPEVELGKPVTFCITQRDPHGLPVWSTHNSMQISVAYGKRKRTKALPAQLSEEGNWEATFTPVCGGKHIATVWSFSTSSSTFTVTGMPPIGSKVVRGPDYPSDDEDEPQTVRKHYIPPRREDDGSEWSLIVNFDSGDYLVRWGDNGGEYQVELSEDVSNMQP